MSKKRTQFDLMKPLFKAFEDSELTPSERLMILALYRHMDGDGYCYPSYTQIMLTSGLTKPTIGKCISSLQSKGWITYKKGSNITHKSNSYKLNLEKIGLINSKEIESVQIEEKLKQVNGRYMNQAQCEMLGKNWEDYPD